MLIASGTEMSLQLIIIGLCLCALFIGLTTAKNKKGYRKVIVLSDFKEITFLEAILGRMR